MCICGGVGRGKSFLMDAFYATVPVVRKTRLHFHEFMRGVHRELEEVKGTQDPLDEVARRLARRYRLICFDEFHVSDVADAMILYRLLLKLFEHGTSFVMTSNYEPSTLYPDGLHRDRILPAIALIQKRMDVLNVDAGVDYRRRSLEQVQCYHTPLDDQARRALEHAFAQLSDTAPQDPVLHIEHREIRAQALAGSVVWFDFATLCGGPRSQNDYLELANRFHAVILSDVPRMGPRQASEARRFTWLIDVFYDHKGQADHVGRSRARAALYRRRAGQRVPSHGVAHPGDAVARIPRGRAPAGRDAVAARRPKHEAAAVHIDGGARGAARAIGRQEGYRGGDFLRQAQASQRHRGRMAGVDRAAGLGRHGRLDAARRHAIDRDPVFGHLAGQHPARPVMPDLVAE